MATSTDVTESPKASVENDIQQRMLKSLTDKKTFRRVPKHEAKQIALGGVLAASLLPEELTQRLEKVIKQLWLFREEQVNLTLRMVHFYRQELEDGSTLEELIESLAPAKLVATRISRRMKWYRPMRLWMLMRGFQLVCLSLLGVLGLYLGMAFQFYFSKPTITRNYMQEFNAQVAHIPEEERAWPGMRDACAKLSEFTHHYDMREYSPDHPDWERVVKYVKQNDSHFEKFHQALRKPYSGFTLDSLPEDLSVMEDPDAIFQESVHVGFLAFYDDSHTILLLNQPFLEAQVYLAALESNPQKTLWNLESFLFISRGKFGMPGLFTDLTCNYSQAFMRVTKITLLKYPELFDEAQLTKLLTLTQDWKQEPFLPVDTRSIQIEFEDLLQRIYTEDGSGDGTLTSYCLSLSPSDRPVLYLIAPIGAAFCPSRKELFQTWQKNLAAVEQEYQSPWWQRRAVLDGKVKAIVDDLASSDENESELEDVEFEDSELAVWQQISGMFAQHLSQFCDLYYYHYLAEKAWYAVQEREAFEAVVAMHLYHKQHEEWPASLEDLVPELLTEVPTDLLTGNPLLYKLKEGKPFLYSVGANLKDDGGIMSPESLEDQKRYFGNSTQDIQDLVKYQLQNASSQQEATPSLQEDWVFWPPLETPIPEEHEDYGYRFE